MLEYVGRYTHRVAISNHRLLAITDDQVRFRYNDYRADPSPHQKTMTLAATEFIRRFLLHVLPAGFHRIRYYGFLGNRRRREKLALCRRLLNMPTPAPTPDAAVTDACDRGAAGAVVPLTACPICATGIMRSVDLSSGTCVRPARIDTS